MSEKPKNKKGQSKVEKAHKGKDRNAKGDSKDQKKPFRDRDTQNEIKQEPKPAQPVPAVNKIENPEKDAVTPFANLKRETDEILKITEGANKYAKREIRSNWTKYELPADNYEIVEENSHGADFEELLQMPMSRGGHFQFKHEKTWGNNKKSSQYSDLFTLDLKYISSALMCVPFYERSKLDPSLFSADQITRMTSSATKNMTKFKKNLPIEREEKELSTSILKKLVGKDAESNAMSEIEIKEENIANEDSDNEIFEEVPEAENILKHQIKCDAEPLNEQSKDQIKCDAEPSNKQSEDDKSKTSDLTSLEKIANVTIFDEDDELDEILGMTSIRPDQIQGTAAVKKSPEMITIPAKPSIPVASNEVDLDKWLDEYLDSDL